MVLWLMLRGLYAYAAFGTANCPAQTLEKNFNGFGSALNKLSCDKLRCTRAWRDCIFLGLRFFFSWRSYVPYSAGVEFIAIRGARSLVESEKPMADAEMIPRPLIHPAPKAALWSDDL